MIALPRKDAPEFMVDEEMEKMGKQMIKHCGGLRLAVRVLGGLLAAKYTFHDWKRVSENLGSHLVGRTTSNYDNNTFYHVLSLSFEELPCYLKHSFLYLAHFPEDYQISVEKLSYYWAAEGILMYNGGETIRDVGDVYIEELVRRNMVISERDNTTSRFEACRLHDMMREICMFKAKEENFLQIDGTRSSTSNTQSRRFVWQYPTTLEVERDINNPKLRSLLIVLDYRPKKWMLSGSIFIRLELLRVLDLLGAKFKGGELPSSIGKLIHLRYLSLLMVEVSHLPSSLGNLKLLMYLNINIDMGSTTIFMPNVLMGMQELKYLALPRHIEEKKKLELSNLVKLETLKNFSTENSSLEDLHGMTMLRTLKILVTHETNWETLSASIGGLRHLENLDIKDIWFDRMIEEGFVLVCVNLKHLELSIYMPRLPDEQHLSSHLTTISLRYCLLKKDPMPILEKLLHLKEVNLHWNSFCGKRMVCSNGGFPQLQMLEVVELKELEEWIVEEGSMPLLHTMVINSCYNLEEWIVKQGSMPLLHTLQIFYCRKLKELPDGLISVRDLGCYGMGKAWEKRLSEGGKYYSKVQHIPSVRF